MSKSIPLGKKLSDMISVEAVHQADKEHYPDLYIESDDKALAQMPDKGEATIKYRVASRTHRDERGKYSCSLRLEVISIEAPAPKGKKKNGDYDGGARKALDNYFKDK